MDIENTTAAGSNELAPNRTRLSRVSRERMAPMAAPAKATSGNDFDPISSICRTSSRNSKGGVTCRPQNLPGKKAQFAEPFEKPVDRSRAGTHCGGHGYDLQSQRQALFRTVFPCWLYLRIVLESDIGCGGTYAHRILLIVQQGN